jgi:hypothetical protein
MEMNETVRNQIADVVEAANDLEMRIGHLLRLCMKPVSSDYGFLLETTLHNTILSFGAKVLLVKRILEYWGWDDLQKKCGRLDDVLRMRNAFAHTPTAHCALVAAPMENPSELADDGEGPVYEIIGNQMMVEAKEGRKLEMIDRDQAFERFKKAHKGACELVAEIKEKVKQTIAQPDN